MKYCCSYILRHTTKSTVSYDYILDSTSIYGDSQKELCKFIWAVCVMLYGEYGTSPFSGWIFERNINKMYKLVIYMMEYFDKPNCDIKTEEDFFKYLEGVQNEQ